MNDIILVDCTLRDGGYYNSWDFDHVLIQEYLRAMSAISVDYVELGFRGFNREGFKGACAYTTDNFIRSLEVPEGLEIGVMVNASELIKHPEGMEFALSKLFKPASESPVSLVRIASHIKEFEDILPASHWLKEQGYKVCFNLMQIADQSTEEIKRLASLASEYSLEALYFADSMGGLRPEQTSKIIKTLRQHWNGNLGIHAHDNMGQALANSLRAVEEGVVWVDGTVTGMGRGPGNTQIEYLAIELANLRNKPSNIIPLLRVIQKYFKPMQAEYGWGTNAYYYLAGKYSIHPTYVQQMLNDSRYGEEDIMAVINQLKLQGGKKFSTDTLEGARNFYEGKPRGSWYPAEVISGRDVLILGTGPGVAKHRQALEEFIRNVRPFVIALNTQTNVAPELIDIRAACHPVRLLADCNTHNSLPQPLAVPASMLPYNVLEGFNNKHLLDFGIAVKEKTFKFEPDYCVVPTSLVIAYTLAIATSGQASHILLAGFDGYGADDPRTTEMTQLLDLYSNSPGSLPLLAITPTSYQIKETSVYHMSGGY